MSWPSDELINVELAVAISLREQYGTNQPEKNYEDGVTEALLWVLGSGKAPNDVEYYHER